METVTAAGSPTRSELPECAQKLEAEYAVAEAALHDMRRWRLRPTAAAYEVCLAYRSLGHSGVRTRIEELQRQGRAITNATIETLHAELIEDMDIRVEDANRSFELTERLGAAALALVSHAASSKSTLRTFSDALRQGVARLATEDQEERLIAVAAITSETFSAAERTRALEQQLASTSAQVEELRESLAAQRRAATTDELTGLSNRRAFAERLRLAIARASGGTDDVFSLLLLDVDHFKRFNDEHGHRTGDLVLRLLGRLLIESIKGRDLAARYGGEEFTVLLMGADLSAASQVARQIGVALGNKRLKLSDTYGQGAGRVTASIGVAQFRATDTPMSLIDRADAAMYLAKRTGRNRVVTELEVPANAG